MYSCISETENSSTQREPSKSLFFSHFLTPANYKWPCGCASSSGGSRSCQHQTLREGRLPLCLLELSPKRVGQPPSLNSLSVLLLVSHRCVHICEKCTAGGVLEFQPSDWQTKKGVPGKWEGLQTLERGRNLGK